MTAWVERNFSKFNFVLFSTFFLIVLLCLNLQFGIPSTANQRITAENIQNDVPENMIRIGNFYIDKYEFPNQVGKFPVTNVTWYEAKAMCEAIGKRLCRFDEWTLACRGPLGLRYMYGPEYDGTLCNSESTVDAPMKIGETPATCVSSYGLHDLLGNVWEWVDSTSNEEISIRGGAWSSSRCAECALKFWEGKPNTKSDRVGFRCCK
jgi:sulfatase modifying factor 1